MKPNALKKISSVITLIIILIMLVRNIHTCKLDITEKAFQVGSHNLWLSIDTDTYKPILVKDKHKYAICSIRPKSDMYFYLFDMESELFICASNLNNSRIARPVTRRLPQNNNCLFTDRPATRGSLAIKLTSKTGKDMGFPRYRKNHRFPIQQPRKPTGFLQHMPHTGDCKRILRDYCHKLQGQKHHRKQKKMITSRFCQSEACWDT